MKSFISLGGPYVIVDRSNGLWWGGAERKTFCSPLAPFANDYEAAGDLTCGVSHPPCNIAKLVGERAEAMLISMPFEIAIIGSSPSCIYLAQAEYAEEDWTLAEVTVDIFSNAFFDERIDFSTGGGSYTLFDSVYLFEEVSNECLGFDLAPGNYNFYASMHKPNQQTSLFLYKIERVIGGI